MNISKTLNAISENPLLHARWLNSLSYLEYRGFRKIIRSFSTYQISIEVLLHDSEEIRHSIFFKRQAVKIGGDDFKLFTNANLLCE